MFVSQRISLLIAMSFLFVPTCALTASDTGIVSVKDHGAKGDGVTDDTAAIKAAVKAAQITRSEPSGIGGIYQTGPVLVFPEGKYIVSDEIPLNLLEIRGEGRAIIHQGDIGKDIFTKGDTWRLSIKNITFSGGRNHINLKNVNIDSGHIIIEQCRFYAAAEFAIRTDVLSTLVQIDQCIFIRNHQTWHNGRSDQAAMRNSWIMAGHGVRDKAVIEHTGGLLTLENITGVPEPQAGIRQRWIDNHGGILVIKQFRFGGEGGGFTPVYNYSKFNDSTYGKSIIIEDSLVFANASGNANCAVYCYEIPNSIAIRDTTFGGATGVIVDPKIDLSTYFQAYSPGLFSFVLDSCTGERIGKLPKGLRKPVVHKPERSKSLLSEKDTKQALSKARKELTAAKDEPFTGGESAGHVQQTDPSKYVEVTDWSITGLMDATSQPNSDWLAVEKVGSDVVILFRQSQPGGWPHATARIKVDLDKFPYLGWKQKIGTAPGAFVAKAIDTQTGDSATIAGHDAWGEYGTGEEYRYYAGNLKEVFKTGGTREIEVRIYPISSYVWDSRSGKAGDYVVIDFMRMEAKQ